MSGPAVILRRAQLRKPGELKPDDYDVFDGDREVGRIYLVHATALTKTWFWGISFRVTKRKSYGYASTLEEAEAAFRLEYETWKGTEQRGISRVRADGEVLAPRLQFPVSGGPCRRATGGAFLMPSSASPFAMDAAAGSFGQ